MRTMMSVRLFSTGCRAMQSSCKEGTKISIDIYKTGKPIVALKDEEYPPWLWTLLDKKALDEELKATDYFRYKRKQIKKKNVERCKTNNFMSKMK